jgi:hypothetical protein
MVAEPAGTTGRGNNPQPATGTGYAWPISPHPQVNAWMEMLDSAHLSSIGCRVFWLSPTASA